MATAGLIRRKGTLSANIRWSHPRTPAVAASRERELSKVLTAILTIGHDECFARIGDAIEAKRKPIHERVVGERPSRLEQLSHRCKGMRTTTLAAIENPLGIQLAAAEPLCNFVKVFGNTGHFVPTGVKLLDSFGR